MDKSIDGRLDHEKEWPHGWDGKRGHPPTLSWVWVMVIGLIVSCLMGSCEPARAEVSEVYGYSVERLADSIFLAEGGHKTRHPYGILTKYKTTTPRQACLNTIRNQAKRHKEHGCGLDFLSCLAKRYCPVGAENDPMNLNVNWLNNVRRLYAK